MELTKQFKTSVSDIDTLINKGRQEINEFVKLKTD